MKMSTKGRYGLRAIVDLAIHSNGDLVALKNIAERQNISEAYLEQVFSTLRKAGVVKSFKGSQGGYVLGSEMSLITVGHVIRILEGELFPFDEDPHATNVEQLLTMDVWQVISNSMNEVVDHITLEDIVKKYRITYEGKDPMFYI